MAWRIEEAVAHGEIDNTVEGTTTGRIWLAGRDEPLILSLDGDCWRDLAGTRLEFENPLPQVVPEAEALDIDQGGIVGDMTASRKVKYPLAEADDFRAQHTDTGELPYEWRNSLYLEWFSEINGRVVIESTDFRLGISTHEWQMDEDAENAQQLANLNAMRDFMAQIIQRREPGEAESQATEELDEFAWEERLKESDRLTDAYQEVLEKYMDDVDSEQKEAFVMGWDGLLDALAERDEADSLADDDDDFTGELEEDSEDDDDEEFSASADGNGYGESAEHPLQAKAQELAMLAMDVLERDTGPGSPEYDLITHLLQVSGKLAGILQSEDNGFEPESGFVLAVLKRCVNWLNEAIADCQKLVELELDPDQRAALEHIRIAVFEVRDAVIELRRQLK